MSCRPIRWGWIQDRSAASKSWPLAKNNICPTKSSSLEIKILGALLAVSLRGCLLEFDIWLSPLNSAKKLIYKIRDCGFKVQLPFLQWIAHVLFLGGGGGGEGANNNVDAGICSQLCVSTLRADKRLTIGPERWNSALRTNPSVCNFYRIKKNFA